MLSASLKSPLETQLSSTITNTRTIGGGCISNAAIIETTKGDSFFVKWLDDAPNGFFAAEAKGLSELASADVIKVPEVILHNEKFIVLEVLPAGKANGKAEEGLGRALASLHQKTTKQFGFSANNFIGSLPQNNSFKDTWGEFFIENRIRAQAKIGQEQGWFDNKLANLLEEKSLVIVEALNEVNEPPSLLHGDLWSGNVFWTPSGVALIDPAVYYGSREADIAMTEMFGRFPMRFYQAYEEVWPLQAGYERRKVILNLYHQMTHSNLFGGGYIRGVSETLRVL